MSLSLHALTLNFCTQWPVGPVDAKSYWPPKKVTGPKVFIDLKKTLFLQYIALQVEGCEFGHDLFCHW